MINLISNIQKEKDKAYVEYLDKISNITSRLTNYVFLTLDCSESFDKKNVELNGEYTFVVGHIPD